MDVENSSKIIIINIFIKQKLNAQINLKTSQMCRNDATTEILLSSLY